MKLDVETLGALEADVAWWLHQLGPASTTLALPLDEHFPRGEPQALLDAVLAIASMTDWSFELVDETDSSIPDPLQHMVRPASPAPVLVSEGEPEPLPSGGPYPIPFTREDAQDPAILIATFARAVSHYWLYEANDPISDDDEEREVRVEVGAVLLGFGVFLANTAFRFQQYDAGGLHGWSSSQRGTLDESELAYVLALFVELAGADPRAALAHLGANPKATFKWAQRELQGPRRSVVDRLRAIEPLPREREPYR